MQANIQHKKQAYSSIYAFFFFVGRFAAEPVALAGVDARDSSAFISSTARF
jgi:hypothetical protein